LLFAFLLGDVADAVVIAGVLGEISAAAGGSASAAAVLPETLPMPNGGRDGNSSAGRGFVGLSPGSSHGCLLYRKIGGIVSQS